MGNEQGRPLQSSTPIEHFDYEALIVVRGTRRSGKSTLVRRMKGQGFEANYEPTPGLEAIEIPWRTNRDMSVKIRVWDVVEHYLTDKSSTPLPDATTVDTLKRANGLIILIDSRDPESVDLAVELVSGAPEDLQVCIFSNFIDEAETVKPVIPDKLQQEIGRFFFIPGSLKTNQGLIELAKWLELPMTAAKRKMYADLFRATDEDLRTLESEFTATARNYQTLESALEHMPEFVPVKKQVPTAPAPAAPPVKSEIMDEVVEDDFWSDGGEQVGEVATPQQRIEAMKPNPMVQTNPVLAKQQALVQERLKKKIRDVKEPPRAKPAQKDPEPELEGVTHAVTGVRRKKKGFWSDDEDGYEEEEAEKVVQRPQVIPKQQQRPQVIPRAQVLPKTKQTEVQPATGLAAPTNLFEDDQPQASAPRRRRRTPQEKPDGENKPRRRRHNPSGQTGRKGKPSPAMEAGGYDAI